jgi:hypothetical protein
MELKDRWTCYGLTNKEFNNYLEYRAEESDYIPNWGVVIGKVVYTHNYYLVFSGPEIDPPICSYCLEDIVIPEQYETDFYIWDNQAGLKLNSKGYPMPWIFLKEYGCAVMGFGLQFGDGENLAEWSLVVSRKDLKKLR